MTRKFEKRGRLTEVRFDDDTRQFIEAAVEHPFLTHLKTTIATPESHTADAANVCREVQSKEDVEIESHADGRSGHKPLKQRNGSGPVSRRG